MEQNKLAIFSFIRSILIAFGSAFAANGWIDSDTVDQLVGGIMVLLPALWGIWDKYQTRGEK